MAKSSEPEKVDVLSRFATANDAAVGYVNRLDTATSKFRKSQRKGSIVKAAQGNLFEFPVFISDTIPVDFATATVSLLEQIYATYLQMAISINPVVDADSVKRGVQFANYKTNTNKYLEYVDTSYQKDVCHAEYINEDCKVEFDLLSIEDKEAKLINEAYDYQPLSEFDHFFQEANAVTENDLLNKLYPVPLVDVNANGEKVVSYDTPFDASGKRNIGQAYNIVDPANVQFLTGAQIRDELKSLGVDDDEIDLALNRLENTLSYYHMQPITPYHIAKETRSSDSGYMKDIQTLCGMITPDEYKGSEYDNVRQVIDDLDSRNPGFKVSMMAAMKGVQDARDTAAKVDELRNAQINLTNQQYLTSKEQQKSYAAQKAAAEENLRVSKLSTRDIPGAPTHLDDIGNKRKYNAAQAAAAAASVAEKPGMVSLDKYNDAIRRRAVADADAAELSNKDINGTTAEKAIQAMREKAEADAIVAKRNAAIAKSRYHRAVDAIGKAGQAANQWAQAANAGVNAATNIASFGSTIKAREADAKMKQWNAAHMDELNALKKTDTYSRMKTSNIQYVRDADCQKLNTMKPLLMKVTLNMLNKDDSLQPIEYIIGVKTHSRMVKASILPEVAKYPLKEMDKISRKIKWRAGELKFFKDLIFRIKEKKQTAADSRDPNRKWYRRLYELAHMQGDAPAAAVVEGKSLFKVFIKDKQGKGNLQNGMIPNASIIMSQADVDLIKSETEIDLLKASSAKKFCGELFLMSLVIVDTDRDTIKILLPDINNDYDVHSLASVNRQLASLDTMGTKTRDMFKMLGA